MALTTGVFNADFNPAELNMRSFNNAILRKFPNGSAPLFALTSSVKKGRAKSATHGYFTKLFTFPRVTIGAGGQLVGDTTFTVVSTAGLVPGMVFQVPVTRELVRVLTIVSATTMTVTRGYGRIAAAAVPANVILSGVGNVHEEGSNRPNPRSITATYIPNYTQIFRNAWAVTDTARASLVEAGFGNVQENRKDSALMHAADIEQALFFSQPKAPAVGANGQLEHATQGIIDAIYQYAPGNIAVAGATTTYNQLVTFLEPMFQYASDMGNAKERVAFCDSIALRVLNEIGKISGVYEIVASDTTFGLQFNLMRFYKGRIRLIEHPMFLDTPALAGTMVVCDLPAVRLAYLEGRDAKVEDYGAGGKAADVGADAIGGSITSEFACECLNPSAFGVISGLTAGA